MATRRRGGPEITGLADSGGPVFYPAVLVVRLRRRRPHCRLRRRRQRRKGRHAYHERAHDAVSALPGGRRNVSAPFWPAYGPFMAAVLDDGDDVRPRGLGCLFKCGGKGLSRPQTRVVTDAVRSLRGNISKGLWFPA